MITVINVNMTLMVKKTWIKKGIMITVGVSVKIEKNITYVKNVVFEILQHVAVKMANMQEVLLVIQ